MTSNPCTLLRPVCPRWLKVFERFPLLNGAKSTFGPKFPLPRSLKRSVYYWGPLSSSWCTALGVFSRSSLRSSPTAMCDPLGFCVLFTWGIIVPLLFRSLFLPLLGYSGNKRIFFVFPYLSCGDFHSLFRNSPPARTDLPQCTKLNTFAQPYILGCTQLMGSFRCPPCPLFSWGITRIFSSSLMVPPESWSVWNSPSMRITPL